MFTSAISTNRKKKKKNHTPGPFFNNKGAAFLSMLCSAIQPLQCITRQYKK